MDKNSRLEEKSLLNEANEQVAEIVKSVICDCEHTALICNFQKEWVLERCVQKFNTEVDKIINGKR